MVLNVGRRVEFREIKKSTHAAAPFQTSHIRNSVLGAQACAFTKVPVLTSSPINVQKSILMYMIEKINGGEKTNLPSIRHANYFCRYSLSRRWSLIPLSPMAMG